jgi:hypothetical protein
LFVKPAFVPKSSGSTRSPRRDDDHFELKQQTIEFYGLWASFEKDVRQRQVFTMLPLSDMEAAAPTPPSVSFSEAVLSHIWRSSQPTEGIAASLHLDEAFHVDPRNFLILRKHAEVAFDAGVLLLMPSADGAVRSRLFLAKESRLPDTYPKELLTGMAERTLFLPLAAERRVPFMRLLGWTVVSHLREYSEDVSAWGDPPKELALDTTITVASAGILSSRVETLRKSGWHFANPTVMKGAEGGAGVGAVALLREAPVARAGDAAIARAGVSAVVGAEVAAVAGGVPAVAGAGGAAGAGRKKRRWRWYPKHGKR